MILEVSDCIICGKNNFEDYLNVDCSNSKESFLLKRCKNCSLILTMPRPSKSAIRKYYDIDYLPHSSINSDSSFFNKAFRKFSYSWKLRLIRKVADEDINMLDIGGGDGSLAFYLKDRISNVHVYEKNIECINHMNDTIITKRINNMLSTQDYKSLADNYYNIITLFHSLEHIHEIDELFFNINRIAKKNANLIIAVPNINASEIYFLTNKWVAWDVPRHLYHFNFETLGSLLNKYGWEVIKSKNMFQDTFFNIYMSLKGNFIKRILFSALLILYSFVSQIFFSKKQSTNLVVCKKK